MLRTVAIWSSSSESIRRLIRMWIVGVMHALVCFRIVVTHQPLVQLLGDEWQHRGGYLGEGHQHLVQRGEGSKLVLVVVNTTL